ncbi:hypothetical protein [Acidovorax sp. Root217]|uniref:hypothetical protein n=1 Tax=Acidovorax sp. Root217 TaxID=1736492 RepID=UPI000A7D11E8|nr:hypothetical protein [Acidovorax sp. Root217]
MIGALLGIASVSVAMAVLFWHYPLLLGLATVASFPFIWLSMAMALLVNRASKQNLLRA